MAEKEQPTYYSILPANVRYNKNLKANEKLLYGDITLLGSKNKPLYANNEYFAKLQNVSKASISKWLNNLEIENLIKINKADISNLLMKKKLNGYGFGNNQCEWCGIKTTILHKHHYPIQKKDGGINVVNICPNCHHEFHYCDFEIIIVRKQDIDIYKGENNGR